jgi:hypothetical protein
MTAFEKKAPLILVSLVPQIHEDDSIALGQKAHDKFRVELGTG